MLSDDLTRTVALAREALGAVADLDWQAPAGSLTWTCWETVEHMSDDLFVYAAQLGPATPSLTTHVRFGWSRRRDGGPALTIFVDPAEGNRALLQVFESCGTMLASTVDAVPTTRQSFHEYGPSDASGFAAMGVVEVLVHMHDVAAGLGLPWTPPADLCTNALRRLFPTIPAGDPWPTLLWATGRGELPGRPALSSWTWDGSVRAG
ncbi:DinB family protein [Actinoplanes sp. NPDC026619]|uniref:DinB family protein n=1 Tax=Actinoplanes sp. NPDC026619 TaxID=3155798 RepID=UPI0033E472A0